MNDTKQACQAGVLFSNQENDNVFGSSTKSIFTYILSLYFRHKANSSHKGILTVEMF